MESEAPMRADRRGFRRWIAVSIVLLPPVALLLANLWLASPFGRGWLAGKLQGRTGLEAHVGGASVSPWNGIILQQVELLQPVALRASVFHADPGAAVASSHDFVEKANAFGAEIGKRLREQERKE